MTPDQKQARDAFVNGITGDLKPVGALEVLLAHSYAEARWRISRIAVQAHGPKGSLCSKEKENNVFALGALNQESSLANGEEAEASARAFLLAVYETRLHRKARADLRALQAIQAARRAEAEKQAAGQKAESEARRAAAHARGVAWAKAAFENDPKHIN